MKLITRITAPAISMLVMLAWAGHSMAQTQTRNDNAQRVVTTPVITETKSPTTDYSVSRIVRPAELATKNDTPKSEASTTVTEPPPASKAGAKPAAPADDDKWHFQFTPYFWMAGLHGTSGTQNRTVQVDESFGDIFRSLNFAFMGVVEARKNKLVVLADTEYVSLEDERATPGPLFSGVNAKFKIFIFDPEAGYRVYENPDNGSSVDIVGGVRIWHISTDFTFTPGILAGTQVEAS